MSPYALLDPAVRLADSTVLAVAHLLTWPGGGASIVAGVVLVTLAVRACLLPVSIRALRAERSRGALAPALARLRRRHSTDPVRLRAETARLYRDAGVSPLAGVGPALAQLPVLATLYRVVVAPTIGGHANLVVSASILGGPLSDHWPVLLSSAGLTSTAGLGFVVVVAALLATAALSSRQAAVKVSAAGSARTTTGARVARLLPYLSVAFALLSPIGVGVYLVVTTAWSAAERALLPRFA